MSEKENKTDQVSGSRKEAAMDHFLKGYNCTQSVLMAFEDLIKKTERKLCVWVPLSAAVWDVCARYAVVSAECF